MKPMEVITRMNRALGSDSMKSYECNMGYSGIVPSTHGGELSVEHVCQVMTECLPQKIIDSVDRVIDMGCGSGVVCASIGMLFRRKEVIGLDNSAVRLKHFDALKDKLQLRNVRCHLVDWNLYGPQDNRWDFMSAGGTTLVICNNFNFDNDRTQENMERLISV